MFKIFQNVPIHDMTAYDWEEVQLHSFLPSVPGGGECGKICIVVALVPEEILHPPPPPSVPTE